MTIAQAKATRNKLKNDKRYKKRKVTPSVSNARALSEERRRVKAAKAGRSFGYKKK